MTSRGARRASAPGQACLRARLQPVVLIALTGLTGLTGLAGLAGLAGLVGIAGCGRGPALPAVGGTEEICLVSDLPAADPRRAGARALLEAPVPTVRDEPRFQVREAGPGELDAVRHYRCLVLLLDAARPGEMRRLLGRALGSADRRALADATSDYRIVRDVWSRAQVVLVLHAAGAAPAPDWLEPGGPALLERLEEALLAALGDASLAAGEDAELSRALAVRYGFSLRVPAGYRAREDAAGRVVRLARLGDGEPPRFLLVHWGPARSAPSTPDGLLALRDSLGNAWHDGDRVLLERSQAGPGLFQSRPATVLHGVYQNERYAYGGPFRAVAFTRGERFYLLDASVFHPSGRKLPYLREVLALAQSFRVEESS